MKKTANTALATNRFDSHQEMSGKEPVIRKRNLHETSLRLSSLNQRAPQGVNKKPAFFLKRYPAEQITDLLWLVAAIIIISLLHLYIPTSGAVPGSIVEVVKSAEVFPR